MNNALTSENIRGTLADLTDPESGRLLSDMGQLGEVAVTEKKIALDVALTTHSAILWRQTRGRIEERLRTAFPDISDVQITVTPHERPPTKIGQVGLEAKSVIAVGSGKGGVGTKVQSLYHLQSDWHELGAKSVFLMRMSTDRAFPTLLGSRDVRQSKRDELFRHNSTRGNLIRRCRRD